MKITIPLFESVASSDVTPMLRALVGSKKFYSLIGNSLNKFSVETNVKRSEDSVFGHLVAKSKGNTPIYGFTIRMFENNTSVMVHLTENVHELSHSIEYKIKAGYGSDVATLKQLADEEFSASEIDVRLKKNHLGV